jgi:hypothetical protein
MSGLTLIPEQRSSGLTATSRAHAARGLEREGGRALECHRAKDEFEAHMRAVAFERIRDTFEASPRPRRSG